jgi:hypothetical protein
MLFASAFLRAFAALREKKVFRLWGQDKNHPVP